MLNKKAVSPLIATVLLIAFAVSLGAIVINFSQESTLSLRDDASQKIERGITCSLDLPINVLEINNEKFICYNRTGSNNLEVIIENQGSASAEGVRIFLLDFEDNPTTRDVIIPLGSHNRTKYNVSVSTTDVGSTFVFPPSKVIISPILDYSVDTIDLCTDNRIDIEEVEKCS
ncbi:hypothetical protein HN789_00930 [archaeon]|jgi:flagellin-like protein|nr:hypothetical protein [archaeon]MBT4022092.1 hypothetical protein [archaeon]MBT4272705.1 hypothetical protein [archaeon]MBT4461504.1 hypothetical protein [archaeon]MBT4857727.1 hypothetical protein [archaeon]